MFWRDRFQLGFSVGRWLVGGRLWITFPLRFRQELRFSACPFPLSLLAFSVIGSGFRLSVFRNRLRHGGFRCAGSIPLACASVFDSICNCFLWRSMRLFCPNSAFCAFGVEIQGFLGKCENRQNMALYVKTLYFVLYWIFSVNGIFLG